MLRADRRAEVVALDDPDGELYGTPMCEVHLTRSKPPSGWTLVDRRPPPEPAEEAGVSVEPVAPPASAGWSPKRELEAIPDEVSSVQSPLLRRAFLGSSAGLTGLERVHEEVDGDPESLRGGVEEDRHEDRDRPHDGEQRNRPDVGVHDRHSSDQGDQDQSEGQDGAHTDSANEVPRHALEHESTARALGTERHPSAGQLPTPTHRAGSSGTSPQQYTALGGGAGLHMSEPTVHQLRLVV
jgi:hypothetical protein